MVLLRILSGPISSLPGKDPEPAAELPYFHRRIPHSRERVLSLLQNYRVFTGRFSPEQGSQTRHQSQVFQLETFNVVLDPFTAPLIALLNFAFVMAAAFAL